MLNEIKMHALLSNQTHLVPRYFQSWVEEGSIFLVTELMDGNLASLNKSKVLSEEELLKVVEDVASCLEVMHRNSIVHFDIKPANILLKEQSNGDLLFKLGDLGLSFSLKELRPDMANFHGEGDARYLAREILNLEDLGEHRDEILKKGDIFSLGISLFELMERTRLELNGVEWNQLRSGQFQFSKRTRETYSGALLDLVAQLMHPDHTQRPFASEILSNPIFGVGPLSKEKQEVVRQIQQLQLKLSLL